MILFGGDNINKQKFLTELARLLTFMYDEDREETVGLYEQMFDSCTDVTALLQYLVSPTRQAVLLARAYNSKNRKAQQDEDEDAKPPFITVIENIKAGAPELFYDENSSLFDDAEGETEPLPVEQVTKGQQTADEAEPDSEPEIIPVLPMQMTVEELTETSVQTDEVKSETKTESAEAVTEKPHEAQKDEKAGVSDEEADAYLTDNAVGNFADAVDAFLADFSIADGELIKNPQKGEAPAEAENDSANEPEKESEISEAPVEKTASAVERKVKAENAPAAIVDDKPEIKESARTRKADIPSAEKRPEKKKTPVVLEDDGDEEESKVKTVRKARVFLLIIYILFAIPITLTLIGILIVPVVACFCIAVLAGYAAFTILGAALGSFTVFAETLVVIGAGLLTLAFAVLFLWISIWLIGGVIVGLVRGVILLAGKWCYKEVAAE